MPGRKRSKRLGWADCSFDKSDNSGRIRSDGLSAQERVKTEEHNGLLHAIATGFFGPVCSGLLLKCRRDTI